MSRVSRRFAPWALAAVAAGGLSTDGRMAAAVDMEKLRQQAFRSYEKDLASRDAGKRRDAADALGGFEDVPATVALLAGALGDTDAGVREAAANSLWELEEQAAPAEAQLRGALADSSPAVRVQAAGALEAIGVDGGELAAARRSVLADGDWFDVALAARDLIGWADDADLQAVNATGTSAFATLVVTNAEAAEAMLAAGFRFSAEEAASYQEWLASEQDPAKRKLLERAGAR